MRASANQSSIGSVIPCDGLVAIESLDTSGRAAPTDGCVEVDAVVQPAIPSEINSTLAASVRHTILKGRNGLSGISKISRFLLVAVESVWS